jgi:TolB-like protein
MYKKNRRCSSLPFFIVFFCFYAVHAPAQDSAYSAAAQPAGSLDNALRGAVTYLNGQLAEGKKIAVLNIESPVPALSDYVIEGLTRHIVNDRRLVLLIRDREQLSKLQDELRFQASGMVSDETAQSIGKMIGAEIIVSGTFIRLGNQYRLSVQALEVESARVAGSESFDVYIDSRLAALLSGKGQKGVSPFWFLFSGGDSWKHKWLYPGARAGWALHNYALNSGEPADAHSIFEAAALLETQITRLFALQTELSFSNDTVTANAITVTASTLTIPLLAKLTWRPGNFYLAVFAGPAFTLPLGQLEVKSGGGAKHDFSPTIALSGGINAGARLGPGVLFLDARYTGDCTFVRANDEAQYRRNGFSLSLGYHFGLINKDEGSK